MVLLLSAVYAFSQMGVKPQRSIRTISITGPLKSLEQNVGEICDVAQEVPARVETSIDRVEELFD